MQLSLMRIASFIDTQHDSNQISTVDDTRNFDFAKKQGYSLLLFWKVLRQTNAYLSNKWPLNLPCAYLNTQGSSPSETPIVETAKSCAIFRRSGQVDFPSFSVHFEYMGNSPIIKLNL
ncbi:hypothetical protein T07_5050 [Trichinella nelsoni]|uniref:Uncharacterized protein n=1 Tax=Trichinella nelsoni TaxID=6336 RepID=A0A0V0RNX8_9BILA|nr:hypothetical protein T07_5050 [Trichinella nelsoni]